MTAEVKIDARGEAQRLAQISGLSTDECMQMLERVARFGKISYELCVNALLLGDARDLPLATLLDGNARQSRLARQNALLALIAARSAEELVQSFPAERG